jgi:hypothetical protein
MVRRHGQMPFSREDRQRLHLRRGGYDRMRTGYFLRLPRIRPASCGAVMVVSGQEPGVLRWDVAAPAARRFAGSAGVPERAA